MEESLHGIDKFKVARAVEVPAKGFYACYVYQGQRLRIIDVQGKQVVDFICFNLNNREEKLSVNQTVIRNGNIYAGVGTSLYSTKSARMFTIVEDTCGTHDLLVGSCSEYVNIVLYGIRGTANCVSNFVEALRPYNIGISELPASFNIFMNVPVSEKGSLKIIEPVSKPGDYIDMVAEMDCLIAVSNCPQDRNACNGFKATETHLVVYEP